MSDTDGAAENRGQWSSRWGFILAAAGGAVGLGNIWKFPYITGENGGGYFVLIYLLFILLIGLPIMVAEVLVGRSTQKSPVGAFKSLSSPGSLWAVPGWLGVLTGFIILSYYSVVAGWALHYTWFSMTQGFAGMNADEIGNAFSTLFADGDANIRWHLIFMVLTIGVILGGIQKGVERAARILMPILLVMLLVLLGLAITSDGFGQALEFVFKPDFSKVTAAGVLEALGHSFFTLSLGMGAMITYGSYLKKKEDLVAASGMITILDTVIALVACLVLFPITFTFGLEPQAGPGLVFINLPIAFSQLAGGVFWSTLFFALLVLAALTSAISLLEVVVSTFIDEFKMSRLKATLLCGGTITLFGLPSALSGSPESYFGSGFKEHSAFLFEGETGKNWFDTFDHLASNWFLPIGGLLIALFVAWRVGDKAREEAFTTGSRFARWYGLWLQLLRYVVPVGVIAVILYKIGLI
ncbi:MAG: sodium-dependent transporter [Planctomycetia bacterium TMED53]|nr:MAG: sodium-dependent transporter [Planctomycetia bacterium TMED53]